jgi:hypothetical protein
MDKGNQLPHFDLVDVAGRRIRYSDIWQRKNLLLVSITDRAEAAAIEARAGDVAARDAVLVVTTAVVADAPRPGVVIADRWGEVQTIASGAPNPDDVIEWLDYVQQRCPECEGEAR